MPLQSGQHRALLFCMLVGLCARLAVAFLSPLPWHSTDTFAYMAMADGILSGHPLSTFPNGYPLLIAIAKLLVPPQHVTVALIWLNIAFSTSIVGFAYDLSRLVTRDSSYAFLVGLFVALYPGQLNISRLLLSETTASFFLVLGMWLLLRGWFVSAGLALAFTGLVRTTLAPVLPVVALLLAIALRPGRELVSLLGGALAVWVGVQVAELRGLLQTSDNLGPNLLIATYSQSDRIDYRMAFTPGDLAHPARAYVRFALSNPLVFLGRRLGSLWQLWGAWPASGDIRDDLSTVSRLVMGLRMPAIMVAGVGFYATAASWQGWALAVPIFVLTAVHTALFSYWRFTPPVEPFVLIFAAAAAPASWRDALARALHAVKLV